MTDVKPEKRRIIFTAQNKMQEGRIFLRGVYIASQSVPQVSGW